MTIPILEKGNPDFLIRLEGQVAEFEALEAPSFSDINDLMYEIQMQKETLRTDFYHNKLDQLRERLKAKKLDIIKSSPTQPCPGMIFKETVPLRLSEIYQMIYGAPDLPPPSSLPLPPPTISSVSTPAAKNLHIDLPALSDRIEQLEKSETPLTENDIQKVVDDYNSLHQAAMGQEEEMFRPLHNRINFLKNKMFLQKELPVPAQRPALPGALITGSRNQFQVQGGGSACTSHAVNFLRHTFRRKDDSFDKMTTEEIDQILREGAKAHSLALKRRKRKIPSTFLSSQEALEMYKEEIKGSGGVDIGNLHLSSEDECRIESFNQRIQLLEYPAQNPEHPKVGMTLTCNGYTYSIAVMKKAEEEGYQYAIFDSHGLISNKASIYVTDDRGEAAQYLARLIKPYPSEWAYCLSASEIQQLKKMQKEEGQNEVAFHFIVPTSPAVDFST
jgi:hypothetical protein